VEGLAPGGWNAVDFTGCSVEVQAGRQRAAVHRKGVGTRSAEWRVTRPECRLCS
jgi:hypothetical protein